MFNTFLCFRLNKLSKEEKEYTNQRRMEILPLYYKINRKNIEIFNQDQKKINKKRFEKLPLYYKMNK